MTPTFNATGLQRFIKEGDRVINPFFVGRSDEINDIMGLSRIVNQRYRENARGDPGEGMSRLIQEPPGIGKTSVLREIQDRCIRQLTDDNRDHYIIPVLITDPKRLSRDHFNQRISATIQDINDRIGNAEMRQFIRDTLSVLQSVVVFGVGIQLRNTSKHPADMPRMPSHGTVLIMIDEIQTVTSGINPAEAEAVLQFLHGGSDGHPVLPVFAGLFDSLDEIRRAGLSRWSDAAIHRMKPLPHDEIRTAVCQFIDHFGITATPNCRDRWVDAVDRWSKGWPKHLQNNLAALGESLLKADGQLNRVDRNVVQICAAQKRIDYYRTRLGEWRGRPALIGTIMARIGTEPVDLDDIEAAIDVTMRDERWQGKLAPEFSVMLRLGLIDESTNRLVVRYHCPIPTLQSFAVAQTGTLLHMAAMCGLPNEVDQCLDSVSEVNARDNWQRTALHLAAQEDWPNIVNCLRNRGAKIEPLDRNGRTPLHYAASENAEHSLQTLLDLGAQIDMHDHGDETPLHHAARTDGSNSIQLLLSAGADPEHRNHLGQTPRDVAPAKSVSRRILDETAH